MRSLATKLTLAFLFVGLTGALLVALVVRVSTQRSFDRFLLDQNQQVLMENLASYYAEYGTWEGVANTFFLLPDGAFPDRDGGRPDVRRTLFTLANADGKVIIGPSEQRGRTLSSSDLRDGVPINVDGETVGWLLFAPGVDRWAPGTAEGAFLANVSRAILLSALLAAGIALVLGGVLAYTLTRSLRELTAATQKLADGQLGGQVEVRSQDEMGDLAESFNRMSSELARANELRQQMTADIAHDLRTPLSVILGYTEALSDQKLSPTPEMFDVMHIEAQHLSHLIEDLKVIALADAGELPLNRQPVNPQDLIVRTAEVYREQAHQKNIQILVSSPEGLPAIRVDVERLAQVLGNLMSNALRYTPAGGTISLSAFMMNDQVALRVQDTGPGISPEYLPLIFERTFRADAARPAGAGESGLGLAIAKSLVEAHQGLISVESQPGKGAIFTVLLPPIN
jgi:signal transduction histidine kinase